MRTNNAIAQVRVLQERDILTEFTEALYARVGKRHVESLGLYLLLIVFWGLLVYLSLAFALP